MSQSRRYLLAAALSICAALPLRVSALRPKPKSAEQVRADYLAAVLQSVSGSPSAQTPGSLWSPEAVLADSARDDKAHSVNDLITVIAAVQTTAAQTGSVDSSRNFAANSAITGVFGYAPQATNPLFAANSTSALKGSGQTASSSTLNTSLTGQVIAVLPNGGLVIEAHRQIEMNNEREEVIVRGIARPADVTPANTVASSSLSSLQIELKGKGVISNSVRPPNAFIRAVLRIFGF